MPDTARRMRLVVHGQQAFGKSVLERILAAGKDDVIAVYGPATKKGAKDDPLVAFAKEKGLPIYQPTSFKKGGPDREVLRTFRALNADLCVMAFVTLFVPSDILNAPKYGTINYHPSLLPLHRGPSAINWSIIHGDAKTGLSIFWPDDGLDTGDLLLVKETPINPDDTVKEVYFNRLFPMGVDAMLEGVELVRAGNPPHIKQDHSKMTYEFRTNRDHARIDWGRPAQQVYNLIRGCNPQPGAWTTLKGEEVQIFDSGLAYPGYDARGKKSAAPGEVLSTGKEVLVACGDGGAIAIRKVKPQKSCGGKKVAVADFVAAVGAAAGDVCKTPPAPPAKKAAKL